MFCLITFVENIPLQFYFRLQRMTINIPANNLPMKMKTSKMNLLLQGEYCTHVKI